MHNDTPPAYVELGNCHGNPSFHPTRAILWFPTPCVCVCVCVYIYIYMSDFEEKFIYSYHRQPLLFKRYIDDCIFLWTHGDEELEKFKTHLNTCHPTIKFTFEISESSVNFLDTTIHNRGGTLETDVYFKPTDSHDYLQFSSSHLSHMKRSLPYSQFLRMRCICTHTSAFQQTICHYFIWVASSDKVDK